MYYANTSPFSFLFISMSPTPLCTLLYKKLLSCTSIQDVQMYIQLLFFCFFNSQIPFFIGILCCHCVHTCTVLLIPCCGTIVYPAISISHLLHTTCGCSYSLYNFVHILFLCSILLLLLQVFRIFLCIVFLFLCILFIKPHFLSCNQC